jgi:hypothetical protein
VQDHEVLASRPSQLFAQSAAFTARIRGKAGGRPTSTESSAPQAEAGVVRGRCGSLTGGLPNLLAVRCGLSTPRRLGCRGRSEVLDDLGHVLGNNEMAGVRHDRGSADRKRLGSVEPHIGGHKLIALAEPQVNSTLDLGRLEPP